MTRTLEGTTGGVELSRPPGVMAQPQPHETVWALATAGFAARCLHVVADLGVADHIDDHAVPVGDLAPRSLTSRLVLPVFMPASRTLAPCSCTSDRVRTARRTAGVVR